MASKHHVQLSGVGAEEHDRLAAGRFFGAFRTAGRDDWRRRDSAAYMNGMVGDLVFHRRQCERCVPVGLVRIDAYQVRGHGTVQRLHVDIVLGLAYFVGVVDVPVDFHAGQSRGLFEHANPIVAIILILGDLPFVFVPCFAHVDSGVRVDVTFAAFLVRDDDYRETFMFC